MVINVINSNKNIVSYTVEHVNFSIYVRFSKIFTLIGLYSTHTAEKIY